MRNLKDVIQNVIDVVPNTINDYEKFHLLLIKLEDKITYSAPEIIGERWHELGLLCYNYLNKYNGTEWEFLVRAELNLKQAEADKKKELENGLNKTKKRKCSLCGSNTHIKNNRRYHPSEEDLNETQGEAIAPEFNSH